MSEDRKVEWADTPEKVRTALRPERDAFIKAQQLRAIVSTRVSVSRFNTYTVTFYASPFRDEKPSEPTHALRLSCDYDGRNIRRQACVRVGEKWVMGG